MRLHSSVLSTALACLFVLGPFAPHANGLSFPRNELSDVVDSLDGVVDELDPAGTDNTNDQDAAQIEPRGTLYTAEYLTTKITELRQKYGLGPVVQENTLVLQAYKSAISCYRNYAGNEMKTYVAGQNGTEEERVDVAWEQWQKELEMDYFNQKFDMWVATRPQWHMVGCAWGRPCDGDINGVPLSCKFWDANNNGTLGPPEI